MIEKRKEEEEKKMRKNKDKEIKGRGSKVERWRKNKNSYLSLNDVSIKYMQVFCVDICLRAVSKKGGGRGRERIKTKGSRERKGGGGGREKRRFEDWRTRWRLKIYLEEKRRRQCNWGSNIVKFKQYSNERFERSYIITSWDACAQPTKLTYFEGTIKIVRVS